MRRQPRHATLLYLSGSSNNRRTLQAGHRRTTGRTRSARIGPKRFNEPTESPSDGQVHPRAIIVSKTSGGLQASIPLPSAVCGRWLPDRPARAACGCRDRQFTGKTAGAVVRPVTLALLCLADCGYHFHLKAAYVKTVYIFLIAAVALSACAARPSDWQPISARLRQGMTEDQAIAAIGYKPSATEVVTCGAPGATWECRMLSFDSSGSDQQHPLILYEANHQGVWRVDSWNVL